MWHKSHYDARNEYHTTHEGENPLNRALSVRNGCNGAWAPVVVHITEHMSIFGRLSVGSGRPFGVPRGRLPHPIPAPA